MVMIRLLTSSVALRLDETLSSLRSISVRELKVAVTGRIQTGSYTNKDGQKVYTTDVVVEEQEFAESKATSDANAGGFSHAGGFQQAPAPTPAADAGDGFMNIPDGIDEELPFN